MRGQIISHTRMNFDPVQISRRSAQFPIHIMTNYMNELKKKRPPIPLKESMARGMASQGGVGEKGIGGW